uniref:Suppressor of cytokine signaling 1 n=1 Tax=Latimeria chalumnae TaxID=7897 RepID=H2ZT32_LATCH
MLTHGSSEMVGGRVGPQVLAEAHENPLPQPQHPPPPPPWPIHGHATHYRLFQEGERDIVEQALTTLHHSGFYWGPLSISKAHELLMDQPVGTFLVRDSSQSRYLFSVSIQTAQGPFSIRIVFKKKCFWIEGQGFPCVARLLEYYVEWTRTRPLIALRQSRIRSLQEQCRQTIMASCDRGNLSKLPLHPLLQTYIQKFPFKI